MKIKIQLLLGLFLLFGFTMYSQKISDKNAFIYTELTQLNTNPNYLINNNFNSIQNNTVVTLNQLGNDNVIDLKTNLKDSQKVNQLGNKNNYTFINYYNANPSNMTILQQGNDNFLQVYGQNSLMSKISIIQKTNAKTLIVKNY
jgi:glucuronate isomerase